MNIDFHYGMTYAIARLGGLSPEDAETVAHASQYVDDATTRGLLKFAGGEVFERFASAHAMYDYRNGFNDENRVIWAPFHFLPAGEGESLEERAICQPNSAIAKEVVQIALRSKQDSDNTLHRLGVTLHVYVDTWAHQGFSGIISEHNKIRSLKGDQHDHGTWLQKLEEKTNDLRTNIETDVLDLISGLGHGAALHFPDMPWVKWTYINVLGTSIDRDNLPQFVQAADMACRVVQAFVAGTDAFEAQPGLRATEKAAIESLLKSNQDHDESNRLIKVCQAIGQGMIPGLKEQVPTYIAKGPGSWKHLATGIAETTGDGDGPPDWTEAFESSDYRKFHDAIKEHRFVVTQRILPQHNLRIA